MVAFPINRPVQIETKTAHIDYKLQYENIVSDIYGWTWWRWLRNITNIADAVIKEIGITDLQSGWIKMQAAWVSVLSRSIKLSSVTRYSNFPVNKKKWGTRHLNQIYYGHFVNSKELMKTSAILITKNMCL